MIQEAPEDLSLKNTYKASYWLIGSLLLPLSWSLVPDSIMWPIPFFDNSTFEFSLNPVEYRTYHLNDILPHYQFIFIGCLYTYCRGLIKNMYLPVKVRLFGKVFRRTFDIWTFYLVFLAMQGIDLFIAFLQIPYYRSVMILITIGFNWYYLYYSSKQVES